MNVLIVENSIKFIEDFQRILKKDTLFKDAHFYCYNRNYENIDYEREYQVVFIDLHLGNIEGLELAKVIKTRLPKTLLVFVTADESLVFDTLEIQPFYFIRKNYLKNDMITFFKMMDIHMKDHFSIAFSYRQKVKHIKVSEIIYVESDGHYLKIVTLEGEYKKKGKIREFQQEFSHLHNFVQIHRSYLINMDYIYEVKNTFIILVNKKEINIGKTYKKQFKDAFQEYLLNGGI